VASPRVPRNAPCPCGSGRKHKLCCGLTRDEEQEAKRQASVIGEILSLPNLFPLLRPDCGGFDRWAEAVGADAEVSRQLLEEGVASLGRRERNRIAGAHGREFPQVWSGLVADLGDERLAKKTVVCGAVLIGLRERLPIDSARIELIATCACEDAAEALVFALDATDLWSVHEVAVTDDALARIPDSELDDERFDTIVAEEADRLATRRHRRRLAVLVARLRARLPDVAYPRASATLLAACSEFGRRSDVRERLLALLLADAVGALRPLGLDLVAA
jgi:SEC-C motif